MRILITGGTGFIGRHLVPRLMNEGYEIGLVTRGAARAADIFAGAADIVEADPGRAGPWLDELGRCGAVINLCGEPILSGKWTDSRKKTIWDSRIPATRNLVDGMRSASSRSAVLLSGSAIGYYGDTGAREVTEDDGPGSDWGSQLCSAWEAEANRATEIGVRVVNLRTGVVLGRDGGALPRLAAPVKWFVGGPIGAGRQYVSWIHVEDYVDLVISALKDESIAGALNLTAPNPVTNREFVRVLGSVLRRPTWVRTPTFALKAMFGEGAVLLVGGQKVLPRKALRAGFRFRFNSVQEALKDLLAQPAPAYSK